ncbi:MAG: glutamate-ammonia-ligase adenylyltransferase [Spirochaetaceae bacterium]
MEPSSRFTGKPSLEEYCLLVPDISREESSRQIELLPESYFRLYPAGKLARFARILSRIDASRPYHFEVEETSKGDVEVRVIALERSFFFSLVSGALSAGGLDIQSGDIFTYSMGIPEDSLPEDRKRFSGQRRRGGRAAGSGGYRRKSGTASEMEPRKVVDIFRGRWDCEKWRTAGDGRLPDKRQEKELRGSKAELERVLVRTLSSLFEERKEPKEAAYKPEERAKEIVAEELSKRLLIQREMRTIPPFYPVELEVGEQSEGGTYLHVRSQDTPFFLYTLGTVLALHDISIEHVEIKTSVYGIEDTFFVRTLRGNPVTDSEQLNSIKLSILFTKQFTHYLWNAPDPFRALLRFETLLRELRMSPESDSVQALIADPNVLRRLSRLLGASEFLWEDFIRLQYENILPLLSEDTIMKNIDTSPEELEKELEERLSGVHGFEEKKRELNDFKDRFTYLADLEHIIDPQADFTFLSAHLSTLADLVVRSAFKIAWDYLASVYGTPRTVADLPTVYAVEGLGKFGGRALGYASDIELLVLYRDAGETDGDKRISNAEFFSHLVKTASSVIESKQEGIYRVDLRLRPHGSGGPLAVSLTQFVSYYRHEASSLEKLALVRMRTVAGDSEFGAQAERLRDAVIYEGGTIDIEELIRLRRVQAEKYATAERPNVKYGPGGLIDLEYCIQILQVLEGSRAPELRTPYMHEVFRRLAERGTLDAETTSILEGSYFFLRRLINALRMLRGNALDLYLPDRNSSEFLHLSRRMGYRENEGVSAEEQLFIDYQKNSAVVRSFVEHRLGKHAVVRSGPGNIADILLSEKPDEKEIDTLFKEGGFEDSRRALSNIFTLSSYWSDTSRFIELALFAWDYLRSSPDPDMALNNWERFVGAYAHPGEHYMEIYRQPKRLEILLRIFAASQFLADLLMKNPVFFSEVTDPGKIRNPLEYDDFYSELMEIRSRCSQEDSDTWRRKLRMFRHRHILRIGSRDICYGAPLEEVLGELTGLADGVLQNVLEYRFPHTAHTLCIFAFGKLGGKELNYSSDIDLVIIHDPEVSPKDGNMLNEDNLGEGENKRLRRQIRNLRGDIADLTEEGRVYRVDFRLRPYGSSGDLVFTPRQMQEYYRDAASLWEFQALLKARPVAGDKPMGSRLLEKLYREAFRSLQPAKIIDQVLQARGSENDGTFEGNRNIKEGTGGIRDIEFLVQAFQLVHAEELPQLICGNTLESIKLLLEYDILAEGDAEALSSAYRFLRRVEHFLQLLEDRQEHTLPGEGRALEALAGRMCWSDICENFEEHLRETLSNVRYSFRSLLEEERKRATQM